MAQSKHTFVESKMNKDLDDRLLSGGQYRNAVNAAVSKSEDSDVGALENVLGNFEISNLFPDGLTPYKNLETIGAFLSSEKDMIFVFLTNFCDTSTTRLDLKAPSGARCLIIQYNVTSQQAQILVEGSFLNFSNTHYITGINLIEDLLFFTDNRNQPRKINVIRAAQSSTYYTTEDQISVVKYAPYKPMTVLETTVVDDCTLTDSTFNGVDSTKISDATTSTDFTTVAKQYDLFSIGSSLYNIAGFNSSDIEVIPRLTATTGQKVTIFRNNAVDKTSEWLQPTARISVTNASSSPITWSANTNIAVVNNISAEWLSPRVKPSQVSEVATSSAPTFNFDSDAQSNALNPTLSSKLAVSLNASDLGVDNMYLEQDLVIRELSTVFIDVCLPNPNYSSTFAGDKNNLKDKFVRFAYRFKFDDNEFSIMSPFTQPIFIPEQDGYFLNKTENYNDVGVSTILDQTREVGESTVINWFQNKVNQIKFNFDFEYQVNQLNDKLKVKELQILYKESDALAIKIIDDIDFSQNNLEVVNNSTSTYSYTYQSAKPFKTLPAEVITRTGDKAPIRALAQESSGNRIIYGNYIDKHTSPLTLNYLVSSGQKLGPADTGTSNAFAQYPNHTLKQNRTYQVGVVLQDRYGRQSDVILAPPLDGALLEVPSGSGNFYGDSTIYHNYKSEDFWQDTLDWRGDSLKVLFRNSIPSILPNREGYPGLYSSDNPLGWYSYKIVVKQKQQEYYNVYLPSLLYGSPIGQNVKVAWDQLCSSTTDNTDPKFVPSNGTTLAGLESTLNLQVGMRFKLVSGFYSATAVEHPATITKILSDTSIEFKPALGSSYTAYAYCEDDAGAANTCCAKTTTPVTNVGLVNSQPTREITFFSADSLSIGPTTARQTDEMTTTLLTDNINKVPADLEEVRPNQLQFKTSDDVIFPRVGRLLSKSYVQEDASGEVVGGSYFASTIGTGTSSDNIKSLGNFNDLFPFESRSSNLYKEDTNPNTGTFTNTFQIGTESLAPAVFSVIETEPTISELDIFWETTTTGLISDLNSSVISVSDVNGITGGLDFAQNENEAASSTVPLNVGKVAAVDGNNAVIASNGITLVSVNDGNGNDYLSDYQLGAVSGNEYPLEAINECVFTSDPNNNNRIFVFEVSSIPSGGTSIITNNYTYTTSISNDVPTPLGIATQSTTGQIGYSNNPAQPNGVNFNFPSDQVIVGDVETITPPLFDHRIYSDNGSVAQFFVQNDPINEFSELTFELEVSLDDSFSQLVQQNNTFVAGGGSSSSTSSSGNQLISRTNSSGAASSSASNTITFPVYDGIYLRPNGNSSSLYTSSSYNIPNGVTAYQIFFSKSLVASSNPSVIYNGGDVRFVRIRISDCNNTGNKAETLLGSNVTGQNGIKIDFVDGSTGSGPQQADGQIWILAGQSYGPGTTFAQFTCPDCNFPLIPGNSSTSCQAGLSNTTIFSQTTGSCSPGGGIIFCG